MNEEIIYEIDATNRLVVWNDAWAQFARENDAPDLVAPAQQLLWKYFQNHALIYLYNQLVEKVRQTQTALQFDYRCDSADRRRYLRLRVEPMAASHVRFRSQLLREEIREPIPWEGVEGEDRGDVLTMCSLCKKINLDGKWVEIEAMFGEGLLAASEETIEVSHGLCQPCAEKLMDLSSIG